MPTKGAGRKKKTEDESLKVTVAVEAPLLPASAAAPPAATETEAEASVTSPPVKKKGGSKKPVKVIAVVTPDGIEGSFTPEPRRPLIAHLPIRPSELNFAGQSGSGDGADGNVTQPRAYDPYEMNPFKENHERLGGDTLPSSIVEMSNTKYEEAVAAAAAPAPAPAPAAAAKSMPCYTRASLMVQFKESSEQKCLPSSTDIACFWCAHTFEWGPCIIPEREVNGVFIVYGNFCGPECAMSYLLGESLDPHVRWERLSLLQRIYDADGSQRIFPAPCRESLKLFGGPMEIETFRATIREKKVRVDLHMPPMVSILGSIDTKPIDFFDTTLKHKGPVTGPAPAAQRTAEEGLRLKRTKPLKDRESTLDTVMNIKIGAGRGVRS
jgi:hypothetical protein